MDKDFTNAHILPPQLLYNDTKDIMKRSRERMVEIASSSTYTCGGWDSCGGVPLSSCGIGGCGGAYSTFRGYSCGGGGGC